jgi:uncharacterized protein (TIGR02001 family)
MVSLEGFVGYSRRCANRLLRAHCVRAVGPGLSLAGQPVRRMRRTPRALASLSLMLAAALTAGNAAAVTFGGDLTAVSDYIFRGVSQNDGNPAAQIDLHAATNSGYFAGVWATTINASDRLTHYELEAYGGKRFQLSSTWTATISAVDYMYEHSAAHRSGDYQEVAVSVGYLDALTFSLAYSPNAVRYWKGYRLGRYETYDADLSGQWSLWRGLFATGGVGFYYLTEPAVPRSRLDGYFYGNVGLALERGPFRLDVGYYAADSQARWLFPYAGNGDRTSTVAASVSWRF